MKIIKVRVILEKGEKTQNLQIDDIRIADETTVAELKVLASEKFLEVDKYNKVKDEVTSVKGVLEDTAIVAEQYNPIYRLYVSAKPQA